MTKCSEHDCPHEGNWAVKLYVPATGYPARPETALSMILSTPFCRRHVERFKIERVLDVRNEKGATARDSLLPIMARMAARRNARPYVAPDCDRAWVVPLRTSDPEYQMLIKREGGS